MKRKRKGPSGAVTPEGPKDLVDHFEEPQREVTPRWVNCTIFERGQVVKKNAQLGDLTGGDGSRPEGGGREAPAGSARLPCLNCPNSDQNDSKNSAEAAPEKGSAVIRRDAENRVLVATENGEIWLGGMSHRERKNAFALTENLRHLASVYGVAFLAFLTLTFRENLTDWKEAQRRFNNATRKLLPQLFRDWVVTVEPQKRGAVHYHLVVVCHSDVRTGFDFEAIARRDYRSASPELRAIWKELRTRLPKYGFGRSELLPVKSTGEGIARYVGKYLDKGHTYRGEQFRGARMVRYSRGWRVANSEFSWTAPEAKRWRQFVDRVGFLVGAKSIQEMNIRFGRHWAWKILQLARDEWTVAQVAQFLMQTE